MNIRLTEKIKDHYKYMILAIITLFVAFCLLMVLAALITAPFWMVTSVKVAGHAIYDNPNGPSNMATAINSINIYYIIGVTGMLLILSAYIGLCIFTATRFSILIGIDEEGNASGALTMLSLFLFPYAVYETWSFIFPNSILNVFDLSVLVLGIFILISVIDIVLNTEITNNKIVAAEEEK